MNNLLRDASISLKVALAPILALIGLVVVAAIGLLSNQHVANDMARLGGAGMSRLVDANALSERMTELHQRVYQSLTWEAIGQRPEKIKELDAGLTKDLAQFARSADPATLDASAPAEQRAAVADLAKGFAAYAKIAADTIDMKSAGVAMAASYVGALDDQFKLNQQLMAGYVKQQLDVTHASVATAEAGVRMQTLVIAGVAALVLVLCMVLSWTIVRMITVPLTRAAQLAGSLARGDLTARHGRAGSDATGRVLTALDDVARNLTTLVTDIQGTADEINTASSEIASGNADLSSRTEGTASSLQQAAASIEQLSATIRAGADNARDANKLASDASSVAREGGVMVANVVQTMDAINVRARKIGDIIGVIDGIAFQTNILALNAAVEAARAGEQGRGFAVVASEVRSLAQRSGDAAREIRTLISSSVEETTAGATKAQAAGQTMTRIVDAIEQVSQTVAGISRSASEQASGISQVNETVSEMERNTQQNAAMVEEATAATESLNSQTRNLVELLTRFRIE